MLPSSPSAAVSPTPSTAGSPWDWQPAAPAAAAWPVSLLALQGPDSLRFLHGQSSQAIELASAGQWLSTCCISPTARMRGLAEVLVSPEGAWLVITSGEGATIRQALDRVLFPADAVRLGPLRHGLLLVPVSEAGAALSPAESGSRWRPLEGGEGFWLGGQLLLLDPEAVERDPLALEPEARELLGRRRLSEAERERWRLQLGLPLGPLELCDDTNPFELGLAPRVSLSKGCYVGQETLAKLATYDGVRRQLRRWWAVADAQAVATLAPGTALRGAVGERAGRITSSLLLPGEGLWIGLALVRRSALDQEMLWSGGPQEEEGNPTALSRGAAATTDPSPALETPALEMVRSAQTAAPASIPDASGAGPGPQGLVLRISRPPAFVDPPVGSGGSARGAGA